MTEKLAPRRTPCASCPYRRDVPSGVWAPEEYEKLRRYDGDIGTQAVSGGTRLFMCHQADGCLCAGWVGHRSQPADLLALRLHGAEVDRSTWRYETEVPLFESGAEAAEHGLEDVEFPGQDAVRATEKITRVRAARGLPVKGADS